MQGIPVDRTWATLHVQGFSTACIRDGINRITQAPHESFRVRERLNPPYLLVMVLVLVLFQGDHCGYARVVARRGCCKVQNRPCLFIADDIGAGGDCVGHIGGGYELKAGGCLTVGYGYIFPALWLSRDPARRVRLDDPRYAVRSISNA